MPSKKGKATGKSKKGKGGKGKGGKGKLRVSKAARAGLTLLVEFFVKGVKERGCTCCPLAAAVLAATPVKFIFVFFIFCVCFSPARVL